ncbi:MAG: hypothetical protein GVY25_00535 [Bacteroidetes bacterium]|nr:hypothetical protein [Bacteroidota bacterium]
MAPTLLLFADEPDVVVGIDAQPLEDRRWVVRSLAGLALDDRPAGPVDEFQVFGDRVGSRAFRVDAVLVAERRQPADGGLQDSPEAAPSLSGLGR